jgi:hypothetical protein
MVGGDKRTGNFEHHYLYCRTDQGVLLVDPTVGQYLPMLKGKIFTGQRAELLQLGMEHDATKDWQAIWSPQPKLWEQPGEYDSPLKRLDFRKKWSETGAIPYLKVADAIGAVSR